jgi:uroporphyrinogen-III synthase
VTVIGEALVRESKPELAGRQIIVTRAPHQAGSLLAKLHSFGATVHCAPAIDIADSEDESKLRRELQLLRTFDWLVITSQNSIPAFLRHYPQNPKDSVPIAVIGPSTKQALVSVGIDPKLHAKPAHSQGLLKSLQKIGMHRKRVLLLQGNQAPETLKVGLEGLGAEVVRCETYRTVPGTCEGLSTFVETADAALFTSGTTARYSLRALGNTPQADKLRGLRVFSIGPQATKELNDLGFQDVVEAASHTIDGLIEALVRDFARTTNSDKERGRRS